MTVLASASGVPVSVAPAAYSSNAGGGVVNKGRSLNDQGLIY